MKTIKILCVFSVFTLFFLVGCVQVKPIPNYAKAGNTIVIGLGSIKRTMGSHYNLKAKDFAMTITDAKGVKHTPKIEKVFKTYPANESGVQYQITTYGRPYYPYDGGWFAVISLVDKDLKPLPIAPGMATIKVESTKIDKSAKLSIDGDLTALPLEILEGTSVYDQNYLSQFTYYQTYDYNFYVKPSSLQVDEILGGASLVFDYNPSVFMRTPVVFSVSNNPNVHLSTQSKSISDTSAKLTVNITSRDGFVKKADAKVTNAMLEELGFYLLHHAKNMGTRAENIQLGKDNILLNTTESYYFDLDGNKVNTVTPVMQHYTDL